MSAQEIRLPGVDDEVNDTLKRLLPQLDRHLSTNRMLDAYYDAERNLKRAFGGVVPEQYYRLGLVLGWSAKAVDALTRRCNLLGMAWADGTLADYGYREVWDGNRLESEVDQAITDAGVHGLAFGVVSKGSGEGDEPGGLLHFYSAADATGERNARRRQLDNLLVVRERDKSSRRVTALTLLLNGRTIAAEVESNGKWAIVENNEHSFGVPAAPMVYRPRLRRPMGRSRLTRPVRGLQDAAGRALVRLEGHMDIYAYPEFWMLGADPSVFRNADGTQMSEMMQRLGRIKGIPDDVDADDPQLARADVKQFEAASPEPHLKALNFYAKAFAREASLPDSSTAFSEMANPTSAESYDASQYELIAEAEGAVREFTPALRRLVPIAMAMQSGMTEVPQAWRSIDTVWRDPRYQSRAAQADAGSKMVAAVPDLARTDVGLELLGMTPQQIERYQSELRRLNGTARIDALIAAARQDAPSGIRG